MKREIYEALGVPYGTPVVSFADWSAGHISKGAGRAALIWEVQQIIDEFAAERDYLDPITIFLPLPDHNENVVLVQVDFKKDVTINLSDL